MWFLCLRRSVTPLEQWTTTLDEHLAWMKEMHDGGLIYLSGPGRRDGDDTFYGVYLIRAGSRAEAERVAAADPFTANGHCTFELIEWDVHQIMGAGGFSLAALRAS